METVPRITRVLHYKFLERVEEKAGRKRKGTQESWNTGWRRRKDGQCVRAGGLSLGCLLECRQVARWCRRGPGGLPGGLPRAGRFPRGHAHPGGMCSWNVPHSAYNEQFAQRASQ